MLALCDVEANSNPADVEMVSKTDFVGEEKIIRSLGGQINTTSMVQSS